MIHHVTRRQARKLKKGNITNGHRELRRGGLELGGGRETKYQSKKDKWFKNEPLEEVIFLK